MRLDDINNLVDGILQARRSATRVGCMGIIDTVSVAGMSELREAAGKCDKRLSRKNYENGDVEFSFTYRDVKFYNYSHGGGAE